MTTHQAVSHHKENIMNAHPKPARVDLGDGDSLILFRTDDYHTTVRFHSANPNTSLAGAVMATDALRAALDKITPAESPDLMDGGVMCAAIEKEAEKPVPLPEAVMRRLTRERDDARAMAALWKETSRENIGRAEVYQERMHAAQGKAEKSRPLTVDDITDEAIRRARVAWLENAQNEGIPSAPTIRAMFAALTEPQRPEGAERWEGLLSTFNYLHDETGASRVDLATLANDLAVYDSGVRVTTKEN